MRLRSFGRQEAETKAKERGYHKLNVKEGGSRMEKGYRYIVKEEG